MLIQIDIYMIQMELAKEEKCEFLPFMNPKQIVRQNGRITSMEFYRTEQTDSGEWIDDEDQTVRLKVNFIISAFGSGLTDNHGLFFVSIRHARGNTRI